MHTLSTVKIYLSANELGRRLGIAPLTLKTRLGRHGIEPDALLINGNKTPGLLFDSDRLCALRQILVPQEVQIAKKLTIQNPTLSL